MSTPWFTVAERLIGTTEKRGVVDNPDILEMYRLSGNGWVKDDETPWCAAFVGACLKLSGYANTGKLNARSYLEFGETLSTPKKGCVVVFWRNGKNSEFGHVGFYDHEDDKEIHVLGGNQGAGGADAVNVKGYPKSRLLGYRWPSETTPLPGDTRLPTILDIVPEAAPPHLAGGVFAPAVPAAPPGIPQSQPSGVSQMGLPAIFFDTIRGPLFGGSLSQAAVDNMTTIVGYWNQNFPGNPINQLAYILATVRAEVGGNMQPVREGFASSDAAARQNLKHKDYGKPAGPYGHVYYGRGYVQLTWHNNYKKQSQKLGIDLEQFPDEALKPENAIHILVRGMMDGDFNRHGHGLPFYVNQTKQDFVGARWTVNVQDRASEIAGYATIFLSALQQAQAQAGPAFGLSPAQPHQPTPEHVVIDHSPQPSGPAVPVAPGSELGTLLAGLQPSDYSILLGALGVDAATRAKLEQVLGALEKAGVVKPASGLTPVNSALGETLGKLLNGKKTVLGVILMLVSIFLPQFGPIISAITGVAGAVTEGASPATGGPAGTIQSILMPLSALLTGWGALGKIDKWMHKPASNSIADLLARIGK